MKTKKLKNKEGEYYKTEEGEILKEHRFEAGDKFIPVFDRPLKRENKEYDEYSIKCKVMDKDGNKFGHEDDEGIFVKLTKTQYNHLNELADREELTQNQYVAYEYDNKYGKQVGVGKSARSKKPISFEEKEKEDEKWN